MNAAVSEVLARVKELRGRYICFSNVHTLVTAVENEKYKRVLNGAEYTFPDGAPIAWKLRRKGMPEADRIAGPDFMEEVFKATADGETTHFFYGSGRQVLEKLEASVRERYPQINIAGSFAPPYGKLSADEDKKIVAMLNSSGADIIWVGLGAPKQEIFMYLHRHQVEGVMIGVGAGFDLQAGLVRRAPLWMQKMSLEWLYRLFNEPERLAKRYLVTNTKFIKYCILSKKQ